jgi:hypothetical protein
MSAKKFTWKDMTDLHSIPYFYQTGNRQSMPEKNDLAIYIIQSVADEEAYATLDETTKNVVTQ